MASLDATENGRLIPRLSSAVHIIRENGPHHKIKLCQSLRTGRRYPPFLPGRGLNLSAGSASAPSTGPGAYEEW